MANVCAIALQLLISWRCWCCSCCQPTDRQAGCVYQMCCSSHRDMCTCEASRRCRPAPELWGCLLVSSRCTHCHPGLPVASQPCHFGRTTNHTRPTSVLCVSGKQDRDRGKTALHSASTSYAISLRLSMATVHAAPPSSFHPLHATDFPPWLHAFITSTPSEYPSNPVAFHECQHAPPATRALTAGRHQLRAAGLQVHHPSGRLCTQRGDTGLVGN